MTKRNLETEYCNDRGDRYFNTYNDNDYTKWLEDKIIEMEQVKSNIVLDSVSDPLCFDDWLKNEGIEPEKNGNHNYDGTLINHLEVYEMWRKYTYTFE